MTNKFKAVKKACKVCDVEFNAKVHNQVYCSKMCRNAEAERLRKQTGRVSGAFVGIKKCANCGSSFKAYKGRKTKYCSAKCSRSDLSSAKLLNFKKREKHLEKIKGQSCPVVLKKCFQCQSTYCEKPSKYKDGFCSANCSAQYQEENKEFLYRMRRGFALISIRVCPETGYIFKATSTKQIYLTREHGAKYKARIGSSKRRALLRNANTEQIDPFQVFESAKWMCQNCGVSTPKENRGTKKHNAPELDHIIPISKGGHHVLENVQLLCLKCNAEKSDLLPIEWKKKQMKAKGSLYESQRQVFQCSIRMD